MALHELSDVDVVAISLVKRGANRKRFFLRKAEGEGAGTAMEIVGQRMIHKADWSTVFAVVAEPGALEGPGIGADAPEIDDRWASPEEIEKACHRFARNGALVNRMHEDLEPFGVVVQNAVALDDFEVNGETIKKGSWYVAIEPTEEGKQAIESGEFGGVSIQATGHRTLVEKADEDHGHLDDLLLDKPTDKDGSCTLKKTAGSALPGLDRSAKRNWVDQVGGLPSLIDRAARHLHYERGRTISAAIATAVNWAKKMCATGTAFGGKVKVSAGAQARACEAVASWEAKKARAKVTKQHVAKGEVVYETPDSVDELLAKGSSDSARSLGGVSGLVEKFTEFLKGQGVDLAELEKADPPTFAERIAQRELDDELPDAMQVLRSCIWSAFYPPPDYEGDPKALIEKSLDEFKEWALELLDRVPLSKREEILGEVPEDILKAWSEELHPRGGKGSPAGGKFVKKGDKGRAVKKIQRKLGVEPDGTFGGLTTRKVRVFQRRHGLKVDGVVGEQTLVALNGNTEKAKKLKPGALTRKQRQHLYSVNASRPSRRQRRRERKRMKKAEGSSRSEGTLGNMSWTEEEVERIEKLEDGFEDLAEGLEPLTDVLADEEIAKSFKSNFLQATLGSTPTKGRKRVKGGGGTIGTSGPRKVSVSSSRGSDRLRVKMHKAAEEAGVELSEETITKALEEFDAEGGLEVDLDNEEAQEPSAEDVRKADERWEREREMLVKAGVPPAMVDSAEPILKREDADIEISDSQSIDAQKVVRDLLKEYEGTIEFGERGAHVVKGSERDEAREQAEAWSEHDRGVKSEAS